MKDEYVIINELDSEYPYVINSDRYCSDVNNAFSCSYAFCVLYVRTISKRDKNKNKRFKIVNKLKLIRKEKILNIEKNILI